ncbi:MAG: sulfotransferase [Pseudomonadota bacterium]
MTQTSPEPLDRPIFVVGHPRSGTTLLASMLGRHPDIVSTPESLYLNIVRFQVAPVLSKGPEAVLKVIENSPMRFLVLDRDILLTALKALDTLSEATVFQTVLECFRSADGKPRLLEKTPWHLRGMDDLFEWFPDARILWIMRDGRACVASLIKVPWATSDPIVLARQWVRNISIGKMLRDERPDQVYMVRYEELIGDPRPVMEPVMTFLGVEPSEEMFEHDREVRTVKPTETWWKENVGRPLMSNRAEAWRKEMDPKLVSQLEMIMGPLLEDFGYATSEDAAPSAVRNGIERLRSVLMYNKPGLRLMRQGRDMSARLQARLKRS